MSSQQTPLPSDSDSAGLDCEHARRQIERLAIDSDLREAERHLLQLHMRACPACRKAFENLRQLERDMKQSLAALDTAPRFTERVMAVLPAAAAGVSTTHKQRVPVNRESSVFVTGSYVRSEKPALPPESRTASRRFLHVWLAAGTAVTLIAVMGFYASYTRIRGENAPPCVASVNGHALRELPGGEQERTLVGDYIGAKEVLISGEKPVELRLESERKFIARLVLAPRSRLRAQNRHTYQVLHGAAYFQVAKDRPGAGEEVFVVEAGLRARVEVTGTAFSVDLQNAAASGALIVVEEGTVRVSAGSMRQVAVQAGEEIDVAAADGGPRPSNLVARMEWMRPASSVQTAALTAAELAANAPGDSAPPQKTPAPVSSVSTAPPVDWNAIVADLPVAGLSFNNAWANLTQRVGPSQSLRDVHIQFLRHMDGDAMRVRFSVHAPLSLKNFVSWLARDVGCRFEIGSSGNVQVRRAVADERLGLSADGTLPPDMKLRLRAQLEEPLPLRDAASLDEFLDRLGARAQLTIVANDPALLNAYAATTPAERNPLRLKSAGDWLRWAERACSARAIWYDGVIYFAPLDAVEDLTAVQRSADIDPAVSGAVLHPGIAKGLREIAAELRYDAQAGPRRAGRPVLTDAVILPSDGGRGGLVLRYNTGIIGDEMLRELLGQLKAGAPRASDPTRLFSQPLPPGPIRDLDELLELSRKKLVPIESRIKPQPFTRQAFVSKNMDFGAALEWAAWLSGAGLRQENGVVIVDEPQRCYGSPRLQVLVLEGVPEELRPAAAARIAALCPEIYPSFFRGVRFTPLHGRVAFNGDFRQLLLAQRIAAALEESLTRGDIPSSASLETWMLPARTKMLTRLQERVQPGGRLAGTFAGMLRQGALAAQLPGSVLVDPQAMKDAAAHPVDVPATTLLEVLQQLAGQAGLTMTLEGDVIWFHR